MGGWGRRAFINFLEEIQKYRDLFYCYCMVVRSLRKDLSKSIGFFELFFSRF